MVQIRSVFLYTIYKHALAESMMKFYLSYSRSGDVALLSEKKKPTPVNMNNDLAAIFEVSDRFYCFCRYTLQPRQSK